MKLYRFDTYRETRETESERTNINTLTQTKPYHIGIWLPPSATNRSHRSKRMMMMDFTTMQTPFYRSSSSIIIRSQFNCCIYIIMFNESNRLIYQPTSNRPTHPRNVRIIVFCTHTYVVDVEI